MKPIVLIITILALFFLIPLLGTMVGAFTGWLVGIFWPKTFAAFLATFGLSAYAPWQIGALFGFCGGFFKSVQTKQSAD